MEMAPTMLFDNECYVCTRFAQVVGLLAGSRIAMVGHYSDEGKKIRDAILDESALEMFWFIDKDAAYGGRAALLPMLRHMTWRRGACTTPPSTAACGAGCRSARSVFVRSASLVTNSRRIDLGGKSK